ncbi:tetraacyldisaccharide 4'-kinase [Legionella shakespearei]|uniref:Tetraacyldisaccharide 4'-kinase n=1 Tax=Legionella shakespearei DSM 23087 TaxID=1122169 RepID=A0A0W0Z7E7_9GAMM|nr:tetraacyldisaccharide 4'-kinase [Legionella shakespearei]KTD65032.1 tetraacyldisaccharide 4'-kinase [Legionella shakespearei DSM 23087]
MSFVIDKLWYGKHPLQWTLLPFSWCYSAVVRTRRWYLQRYCQSHYEVPIIVVGNITVGGVGKTPLVIEIAKKAQQKGLRVGIVSRGYGAKVRNFPYEVQPDDSTEQVGDEPLLIAHKTGCPVVIAPQRTQAIQFLLEKHSPQIIISDDGLQHYKMGRAVEIAVIDGTRGLGNGFCLPAGPLREPDARLKQVDFLVVNEGSWINAFEMNLKPGKPVQQLSREEAEPDLLQGDIAAVAAIGNPQRFYSTLSQLGIEFTPYSYPDHYQFQSGDFDYSESLIIMTEKDAVKCRSFMNEKMYYLPVEARLNDAFWDALWSHKHLQGYC